MTPIIENAKIISTKLTIEDHGCLSGWIMLEMDGTGVGFGGYVLWNKPCDSDYGSRKLYELLNTLEVGSWEDLRAQYVRVETEGFGGKCLRIGHIIKDRWFSWKETP